jgi:TolB-like protein/Flp pilus assembly protein TadD
MNFKEYMKELKRRNVFRSAITYLLLAWLIAQVSAIVLPAFNAPQYFMKVLISVLIAGFPISLVFAWVYQFSPKGIKKIQSADAEPLKTERPKIQNGKTNKKLVVLPFQNIGSDNNSNYFSDGLTEEIIIRLSGIKELDIASRSTSMRYRDSEMDIASLGRALNARYILQGAVRTQKDVLRISTELIDVESDSELWAEIYSGKIADVFQIQEKVSKKIVKSLQLKLTPKEKVALSKRATLNSDAHIANLRAREFLFRYTKSYLLLAIDLFQNAIDLDSKYASAYAGMAEACALLFETHDKNLKWIKKAEDASLKALIYDPTSSEAYSALGLVYYNKNSPKEALMAAEKAILFDPDNFFAYWVRGRLFRVMERDAEAVFDFNKVLELNRDFHSPYGDLQMAYETLHDEEKLQETIEQAALFYPSYLLRHPDDSRAHQFYAFTLKRLGRLTEAKKEMHKGIAQNPNDPIIVYNAACFYALIDDKAAAVENLKKAMANGFENYDYLRHDPDLSCLQNEPDFIDLLHDKSSFKTI